MYFLIDSSIITRKMKIRTIEKLIFATKKELDSLLIAKAAIEERIAQSEAELSNLKESFNNELEVAKNGIIFDLGEFIKYELKKQSLKAKEISHLICERESILETIVEKNVTKKTYEHLMEQLVHEEDVKRDKIEIDALDSYNISKFNLVTEDV
jgi:hypothetical protein